jgi:GntR family transcriptional regulator, transcriptional repressor for pyruvate dehydrogenase complex
MNYGEPSLSERLADDIVEIIRAEGLVPGDMLVSSRELARRFDVTTPTVREALRRLEATGVVELRHGSGTYVGPGSNRRLLANPHLPRSSRESVLELVEARLIMEPAIAAMAARTRVPEAVLQLEAAASNALRPTGEPRREAVHFHVALAAAGGNALLREAVEALLDVRARERVGIRHRCYDRERDHTEHLLILDAVRDGDAEGAARLTREHLTAVRDAIVHADFPEDDASQDTVGGSTGDSFGRGPSGGGR